MCWEDVWELYNDSVRVEWPFSSSDQRCIWYLISPLVPSLSSGKMSKKGGIPMTRQWESVLEIICLWTAKTERERTSNFEKLKQGNAGKHLKEFEETLESVGKLIKSLQFSYGFPASFPPNISWWLFYSPFYSLYFLLKISLIFSCSPLIAPSQS